MPAHQKIITCSYLEVHKDIKENIICYIQQKKKAINIYLLRSMSLSNTGNTLGKALWIHAGYVFSDT